MATIDIPIGQAGEVLEVSRKDLQENESFVFSILNDEVVALRVYLDIALEYWKQGLKRQFMEAARSGLRRAKKAPDAKEKAYHLLLLNLLASYFIEEAKNGKDLDTTPDAMSANECIIEATTLLNDALMLEKMDAFAIVASGNIRLFRKEYSEALSAFEGALTSDANCIPALLGQATVRFATGQPRKALELYQKVLRLKPDMQPDVRVPIGICYYHLYAPTQARRAFKRALDLNPNNADALMLLSILDWNHCRKTGKDEAIAETIATEANTALLKVFRQNSAHPLFSCQMAQRKLIQKDYARAERYADRAFQNTTTPSLQAEAMFCKAKALWAQNSFKEATKCLGEAAALNPNSMPVQFALASGYAQQGQFESACQCLEAILAKEPDNTEVLVRLASLYSQSASHRVRATSLFESALKNGGKTVGGIPSTQQDDLMGNPETLLDMARALEHSNLKRSLELHVKAYHTLLGRDGKLPAELYNNIGVFCHILGEGYAPATSAKVMPEARAYADTITGGAESDITLNDAAGDTAFKIDMLDAILTSDELWCKENLLYIAGEVLTNAIARSTEEFRTDAKRARMNQVTIKYNLARVQESLGHTNRAVRIHEEILAQHPAYADSRLRLGIIYLGQEDFLKAIDTFTMVVDADPKSAPARLHLGRAYLMADRKIDAKRTFDAVLKSIDNHSIPALVALAHVQLGLARAARHDPKEREDWILRAHRLYDATLKADNLNVPAAVGMGIILAESGFLQDARSVFAQVEQATGNNPAVAVNLAHVILALDEKDAKTAIPLYEKAIKKGYSRDPYVLAALSRAYYILARERKDDLSMKRSLHCIEQAVRINPSDSAMIFNLALVKQQMAGVLNDQPIEKRDLSAMHIAMDGINTAERLLEALAARTPESRPNYSLEHAIQRRDYCKDVRKLSEKKIHETTTLERQREERKEAIRDEQRAREEQKRLEKEEESARQRQLEAQREALRAEAQAKVQANEAITQQEVVPDEKEGESSRKKGKKRERNGTPESEEEGQKERKRKLRKKAGSVKKKSSKVEHDDAAGDRSGRKRRLQSESQSAEFVDDSDSETGAQDQLQDPKSDDETRLQGEDVEMKDALSSEEENVGKLQRPAFDDSDDEVRDGPDL
ncbi:protein required for normal CLN1 and CLN2 G1 cyclin expression [Thoreauomyces humboldtii]|nr:protein required for normal CLN1 and CLN2 G1 cyclin expression [Thoreauomyces humboldtii]